MVEEALTVTRDNHRQALAGPGAQHEKARSGRGDTRLEAVKGPMGTEA